MRRFSDWRAFSSVDAGDGWTVSSWSDYLFTCPRFNGIADLVEAEAGELKGYWGWLKLAKACVDLGETYSPLSPHPVLSFPAALGRNGIAWDASVLVGYGREFVNNWAIVGAPGVPSGDSILFTPLVGTAISLRINSCVGPLNLSAHTVQIVARWSQVVSGSPMEFQQQVPVTLPAMTSTEETVSNVFSYPAGSYARSAEMVTQ